MFTIGGFHKRFEGSGFRGSRGLGAWEFNQRPRLLRFRAQGFRRPWGVVVV